MTIRYLALARRLVSSSAAAYASGELFELVGNFASDEEAAYILIDDEDKRQSRLERLRLAVEDIIVSYEERRLVPPLRQSESALTFFVYNYDDDPSATTEARDLLARYRLQPKVLNILQALDDTLFERLCGRLLMAVGCTGVTVTQQSQDRGLDFLGRLPMSASSNFTSLGISPFVRLVGAISFLIYGQAKRYEEQNSVGADTVHQLVGSWRDLRNAYADNALSQAQTAAFHRAGYRAADPALLVIAATSDFSRGARNRAASLGVVLFDGEQLAQLILELGIGVRQLGPGSWETDSKLIEDACTYD